MMVPTMYARLLALGPGAFARRDLSSLRWLMSGAAPLPTELRAALKRANLQLPDVLTPPQGSGQPSPKRGQ